MLRGIAGYFFGMKWFFWDTIGLAWAEKTAVLAVKLNWK
jgi:hypothetical protein